MYLGDLLLHTVYCDEFYMEIDSADDLEVAKTYVKSK